MNEMKILVNSNVKQNLYKENVKLYKNYMFSKFK